MPAAGQSVFTRLFEPQPWMAEAACRGLDVNLFFPERGEPTKSAKAVCADCPVQAECLQYALDGEDRVGVFGGASEKERRAMRREIRNVS